MNPDKLLHLSDLNLAECYREDSRWSTITDIAEQGDALSDLLISRAKDF